MEAVNVNAWCGNNHTLQEINLHIPANHASALDPVSTSKIEDMIFQLKSQYTIVIVTHNMPQAAWVAEKTGFFLNGRMVEFDSTHKIFTNPSDKRTEDYITGRFG